ncbi:MAG: o-succinylbenzoate synthase [Verrucomicrobia bacterium]|nr:o-succinylbenzoate synthase [Verrucomicrobiota bacterium]
MIIKSCKFYPFLIDSCCLRKGILLHLTGPDGRVATAEISPLPGYSTETLDEALQQLHKITKKLLTTWWTKQALHYLNGLGLCPSVYFGVESALLDLLEPPVNQLPCLKYALLFGSPEEILYRADEAYGEGHRRAKIKLGHFTPESALDLVKKLDDRFILRLDLNRKWKTEDTLAFCQNFPEDHFEYIEEPTSTPKDLIHFPYPYALDETLRDHKDLKPFLKSKNLKAFIIKPTMAYPFAHLLNLGPQVVLTSSFESHVGIAQIEKLIHRLGLSETYHGLDTLRYFEEKNDSLSCCEMETGVS